MKFCLKAAILPLALAMGTIFAHASGISYTCDSSIDATSAGLCSALNTTVAADYNSIFSNANASIYIQFGTTGLGESTTGFLNLVSYDTYLNALTGVSSGDTADLGAIASLPILEPSLYSSGQIELTSALEQALGIAGGVGTTSTGAPCFTPGSGGCYNGIITITTPANLSAESGGTQGLFFGTGSAVPADDYDFFSVVEHETDEVLGTSSCIGTGSGSLSDGCAGATNAAAVDLFRYQNSGNRVFESTTPGAYFSYNGGVTQTGPTYNTLANGDDYADFSTNCTAVQDATGCTGLDLDIATDGGAEVTILDTVGYNLKPSTTAVTPEPGTLTLLGTGLLSVAAFAKSRVYPLTRTIK